MEVVRFANRAYEHVAVFRNPQFDTVAGRIATQPEREWAGAIDNSLLEKESSHGRLVWSNGDLRHPGQTRSRHRSQNPNDS